MIGPLGNVPSAQHECRSEVAPVEITARTADAINLFQNLTDKTIHFDYGLATVLADPHPALKESSISPVPAFI
jgi:hypothetical protein